MLIRMAAILDDITLDAADTAAAHSFYTSALGAQAEDGRLDLHGTAAILIGDATTPPTGFRGYTMSYIVKQPTEVETVLAAAAAGGAEILKPAKKMLFGAFSGVFRAPDGSIWKVAAPTKKDTGPSQNPPVPTETAVLLAVDSPKASKSFYEALGLTTDRDYGNKYIDFAPAPGCYRLGLMQRKALAKDVGVDDGGSDARGVVFGIRVETSSDTQRLLDAAVAAGGTVSGDARFLDPDGHAWVVTAP